jgi:hypothetical protein
MATPLKRQFPVEAGTVLGSTKCHCCGKPVQITASKTGLAIYNCYYPSDTDATPCNSHFRWGGVASRDMRRAYLERTGQIEAVRLPKKQGQKIPANDNRAPAANDNAAPAAPKKRGGILDEYEY